MWLPAHINERLYYRHFLTKHGQESIESMAALLSQPDMQVKQVGLEFFKNMFLPEIIPEGQTLTENDYAVMFEEAGGIEAITDCADSHNESVAILARELLLTLTDDSEEDGDVESSP